MLYFRQTSDWAWVCVCVCMNFIRKTHIRKWVSFSLTCTLECLECCLFKNLSVWVSWRNFKLDSIYCFQSILFSCCRYTLSALHIYHPRSVQRINDDANFSYVHAVYVSSMLVIQNFNLVIIVIVIDVVAVVSSDRSHNHMFFIECVRHKKSYALAHGTMYQYRSVSTSLISVCDSASATASRHRCHCNVMCCFGLCCCFFSLMKSVHCLLLYICIVLFS